MHSPSATGTLERVPPKRNAIVDKRLEKLKRVMIVTAGDEMVFVVGFTRRPETRVLGVWSPSPQCLPISSLTSRSLHLISSLVVSCPRNGSSHLYSSCLLAALPVRIACVQSMRLPWDTFGLRIRASVYKISRSASGQRVSPRRLSLPLSSWLVILSGAFKFVSITTPILRGPSSAVIVAFGVPVKVHAATSTCECVHTAVHGYDDRGS